MVQPYIRDIILSKIKITMYTFYIFITLKLLKYLIISFLKSEDALIKLPETSGITGNS